MITMANHSRRRHTIRFAKNSTKTLGKEMYVDGTVNGKKVRKRVHNWLWFYF